MHLCHLWEKTAGCFFWGRDTLPKTNSLPLKMVVSKFGLSFSRGVYFQGRTVSFREGHPKKRTMGGFLVGSTNGYLVVWGAVVWIFGILSSKGLLLQITPRIQKKMGGCLVGSTITAHWWLGPLSINPFHKGIPKIQTTNSNHQLTKTTTMGAFFLIPRHSMGLVYLPTWMVNFYGTCR